MRRAILPAVIAVSLLSGCTPTDAAPSVTDLPGQDLMDEVAGTWLPDRPAEAPTPGPYECPAELSLAADGFWTGVGAYPGYGSWRVDRDGELTTVLSPSYGTGDYPYCDPVHPVITDFTGAASITLDEGLLVLRGVRGNAIATFRRAPERPTVQIPAPYESPGALAGRDAVGTWTSGAWALTLSDDLIVSGTDGCNSLRGSWFSSRILALEAVRTLRACDAPESWTIITGAALDGSTLVITTDDGGTVRLERSAA